MASGFLIGADGSLGLIGMCSMTNKTMKKDKGVAAAKNAVIGAITKDMGIMEIVQSYPETVDVFFRYGMHCLGCVAARFETLEQGATAHGIDIDKMVRDLNAAVKKPAKS